MAVDMASHKTGVNMHTMYFSATAVYIITWWKFLEWAFLCPPEHTNSSLWTGGTGPACKGPRAHSRGWKWPRGGSAEPRPRRSVSPGHKRELSLKPWETHSIQRHTVETWETLDTQKERTDEWISQGWRWTMKDLRFLHGHFLSSVWADVTCGLLHTASTLQP